MVGGEGYMEVGTPTVDGARVMAEVLEHGRDRKILVFKYKNKTRYRRRHGHRQDFTRLAIRQILLQGEEPAPVAEKPAVVEEAPQAAGEVKPSRTSRRRAVAQEQPTEVATEPEAAAPEATPAARHRRRKQTEAPDEGAAAAP